MLFKFIALNVLCKFMELNVLYKFMEVNVLYKSMAVMRVYGPFFLDPDPFSSDLPGCGF